MTAAESLRDVLKLIEDGVLVRNTDYAAANEMAAPAEPVKSIEK